MSQATDSIVKDMHNTRQTLKTATSYGHQDNTVENLHRRCPRDGLDDEKADFVKKLAQSLANVVKAATSATSSTTSSSIFSGSVIAESFSFQEYWE